MICDLHVHTTFSDGKSTPTALVRYACELGLEAIGIADHDSVGGIDEAIVATKSYDDDLEVVPAIELNTDVGAKEVHVLGYLIDWHHPELIAELIRQRQERCSRAQLMVKKLNELGLDLKFETVLDVVSSSESSICRPHIARALKDAKLVETELEAFQRYLYTGGPAYVKHPKLTPVEAIKLILSVGGVPVLAHPGTSSVDMLIPKLIRAGLMGIEVYHPKHDRIQEDAYLKLAEMNKLIVTGGSDWHGDEPLHGPFIGDSFVSYRAVEELKAARAQNEKLKLQSSNYKQNPKQSK